MSLWQGIIIGLLAGVGIQVPRLLRSYSKGMKERAARLDRFEPVDPYAGFNIPLPERINENDPGRVVFHFLVRAALVWGLDKNSFAEGPHVMDDGCLVFHSLYSASEGAYYYLHEVGLLEGTGGNLQLACPLDDLGAATDDVYDKGIDLEAALEEMISLIDNAGWLNVLKGDIIALHRSESSTVVPVREGIEFRAFLRGLAALDYADAIPDGKDAIFRLTEKGVDLLRSAWIYIPNGDSST